MGFVLNCSGRDNTLIILSKGFGCTVPELEMVLLNIDLEKVFTADPHSPKTSNQLLFDYTINNLTEPDEVISAFWFHGTRTVADNHFPDGILTLIKEGQDEVFLMMEIRNYDTSPLMIVSADVDGSGNKLVTRGKAGWQSRCTFSSDANRNEPLTVRPGQTVWVMVENAVLLKGLNDLMNGLDLKSLHNFEADAGVGIYEVGFVDILNKALEKKYGKNAEIVASLYTGPDKNKHIFSFPLNQGKDFFSKDGSLQHDWLLAKWIKPGYETYIQLSKDCESKL